MYKHSISVVVPVYNASNTIETLINELISVLHLFEDYQIILVNDCSKDDSEKIIKRNLPKSKIKLINMKENVGQQKATFIGLMEANSDYTVIMDDDLETNPSDILKLYNEVMKGYDVVYGINLNDKGKSFHRTFGALMRDVMFRVLTKIPKGMKVCSFRIMNKSVVNQILKSNKRFVYISMEILRFTSNISNIFVPYNKNKESNYTMKKLIKLYMNILINYGFKGTLSSNNDLYEPDYTVLGEDYL